MLRVLGALLLSGGCIMLGFGAAENLGRRVKSLDALIAALEWIIRELSFRLTGTPELLTGAAQYAASPADVFFRRCGEKMERLGEQSFAQLWDETLAETPLNLAERDLALMRTLGSVLGRYDGSGQMETMGRVLEELRRELGQAEEEQRRRGRVDRVLGVAAGAFLAILLL